jgi:outer membrane protein assembly factor BamA
LRRAFTGSITWTHRYSFYNRHFVKLGYNRTTINDTIAILNPNYLLDGRTKQRFFTLSYRFTRDHRDNVAYPLAGKLFSFRAEKNGLGIFNDLSRLSMRASYSQYFKLKNEFYLSSRITGLASFPKRQAYFNTAAIGYRPDDIRGYDLNVVEGQNYILNKITFKKLLFSKQARIKSVPIPQFQTIPIAVYLKTFFDSGYIDNELSDPVNRPLSNKYLFGGGIGLDVVTYYDLVMRLEYSINDQGNTGFFINVRSDI